jgi:hypothetical protein
VQAGQKLEVQLNASPVPFFDHALCHACNFTKQVVHDLRLACICHQHNSCEEGRLEWLLDHQLMNELDKVTTQQLILIIIDEKCGDRADLLVPSQDRVLGEGKQLSANANVRRRAIESTPGTAMSVTTVAILLFIFYERRIASALTMKDNMRGLRYLENVSSWGCILCRHGVYRSPPFLSRTAKATPSKFNGAPDRRQT